MSDFARTPTRPGATTLRRTPATGVALDDTADELEPVEPDRRVRSIPVTHDRRRASRSDLEARIAQVEVDIDLPSWAEFRTMRDEVRACREDRLRRARWRWPWTIAKGLTGGGVIAALVFVASALISYGDARNNGRRETALVEEHETTIRRYGDALLLLLQHTGVRYDLTRGTAP